MAAHSGPWVEGHEAERLRRSRVDGLPRIDVESLEDEGDLVHERDVHGTEQVLDDFRGLRDPRMTHGDHPTDHLRVEGVGELRRRFIQAPDELRDVLDPISRVARVDPLGRERDAEVHSRAEPSRLEDRDEDLFRRPRVRCALEDDELPRSETAGDLPRGVLDLGEVGVVVRCEGRPHGDHEHVAFLEAAEVRRRQEPGVEGSDEVLPRGSEELPFPLPKGLDQIWPDVKPEDAVLVRERQGQRGPHVPEPDHSYDERTVGEFSPEGPVHGDWNR